MDDIGDRMKEYEARFAPRLMPLLPTLVRIDGKNFHRFCQGLKRPYDENLSEAMKATTAYLMNETRAVVGYTQSDEITLCFYSADPKSQTYFNGKMQKLVSVLAAEASVCFNSLLPIFLPTKADLFPVFDCRVWQVPTLCEAANVFVWRELDATRNSVEMLARFHYSHRELLGVGCKQLHELIHQKGDNWNNYPVHFKRGVYFGWKEEEIPHDFSEEKCAGPAHPGPRFRKRLSQLDLQPILTYPDRVAVFFGLQHSCGVPTTAKE